MIKFAGLLLTILLSCQERQQSAISPLASAVKEPEPRDQVREEWFVDSTGVGKKKHNKIELAKYRIGDSVYVIIKFFSKNKNQWELKDSFYFEKDRYLSCNPKLSDFNNDGLNDLTYVFDIAARGSNDLRRLFVYDKKKDRLVFIKNSDNYPNLHYNKLLNCIDAFKVYGGTMSEFLRLSGDSLVRFASVELFDGLTVCTYDRFGNETVILKDTAVKDILARYKNYNPLQEYTDEEDFQ